MKLVNKEKHLEISTPKAYVVIQVLGSLDVFSYEFDIDYNTVQIDIVHAVLEDIHGKSVQTGYFYSTYLETLKNDENDSDKDSIVNSFKCDYHYKDLDQSDSTYHGIALGTIFFL